MDHPNQDWRPGRSKDAIKRFSDLPLPRKPALPEQPRTPSTFSYHEPVVNSEHVKWKPVDEVAARVVRAAKWYEQPPQPPPNMSKQNVAVERGNTIPAGHEMQPNQFESNGRIRTKRGLTEDGHVEELYNERDLVGPAVEDHENHLKKDIKTLESFRERARDLLDSISYILRETNEPFEGVEKQLSQHLNAIREKRFAVETETRLIMNQLKDVRQFFLDSNYEEQIDRLRDFVGICERLQALKESGFLDTVADTMIRLANPE